MAKESVIVLFGESGQGKSLFGSRLVDPTRCRQPAPFPSGIDVNPVTRDIKIEKFKRKNQVITVVDTPGFTTSATEKFAKPHDWTMTQKNIAWFIQTRLQEEGLTPTLFIHVVKSHSFRATTPYDEMISNMKAYFPDLQTKLVVAILAFGEADEDRANIQYSLDETSCASRIKIMDSIKNKLQNAGISQAHSVNLYTFELMHTLPTNVINLRRVFQVFSRTREDYDDIERLGLQAVKMESESVDPKRTSETFENLFLEQNGGLLETPESENESSGVVERLNAFFSLAKNLVKGRKSFPDYEQFRRDRRRILNKC